MQERGLAAYLAELIGTLLLVFFITSVVALFLSTGSQAQFGSDFAVIGLVHAFLLFGLIVMFGVVSGGHFNPAVTIAALAIKRISAIDGVIYILAQLSGGVLGALLAAAVFRFVLEPGGVPPTESPEPIKASAKGTAKASPTS